MGVLNATPDSFSDAGELRTLDDRLRRAEALLDAGADLLDIGGESNVTNRPAVSVEEELDRVAVLIERVVARARGDRLGRHLQAAGRRGGRRGRRDDRQRHLRARRRRARPRVRARRRRARGHAHAGRAQAAVARRRARARRRRLAARARGARRRRSASRRASILDPGPDFGKTPAQTVAILRELPALVALGHPVLLAVSRKDFVGAIALRRPRERLAGHAGRDRLRRRRRRDVPARPRRPRGRGLPRRPRGPARRARAARRRPGARAPAPRADRARVLPQFPRRCPTRPDAHEPDNRRTP